MVERYTMVEEEGGVLVGQPGNVELGNVYAVLELPR